MIAPRSIVHVDMDAFYAAIEQRDRPELRGRPVVVGADPRGRGVVSAASYEARAFGVRSAMPITRAARLCPHAEFLPVDMEKYQHVSRQIMDILGAFSPLIEQVSIDEAFVDLTGTAALFGEAADAVRQIKARIRADTGLTASAGLGANKFVAKVASDLRKPDGFDGPRCPPGSVRLNFTEQRFSLGEAAMERQIAYDKLAREDRFVRMRARDTAALKVEQGLPPFPDLASRASMRERVHGILVGELQAMEGAGRTVYDFPDAPWEFTLDMARQVWDESRHVEIYLGLLDHLGGYVGEFPESTILWRCACAEDAAARVAGVNRGLEGLACDVFNQLIHIAGKIGDPIIEKAVDYVLADEITHVRMGSKWLNRLTEGDPERRRRAIEFQESIDERFNLGGVRQDGAHEEVQISIAKDARRLAGFSDEEIERLIKTTQRSPVY